MNAHHLLTLVFGCLAMLPSEGRAGILATSIILVESEVETVLTNPFGATGPVIDVYHLVVENPNPAPATSIELNLSGPFLNNFTFSTLDFQDNTSLPAPAGTPVADSFLVTPPGTVVIGRNDIDDENGILSAAYTIQGGATFVEAGGSAVLAVLSVPTGTPIDFSCFISDSFAAVAGVLEPIDFLTPRPCVPEPSSGGIAIGLLAGLVSGSYRERCD